MISVSDKSGLPEFAARLVRLGVQILSTGGTARLLSESGIEVEDVSDYTGFPEILGGRIKTLHPKVHGGLLARRGEAEDMRQMEEHGIRPIDMVVVNLYPFVEVIAEPGVELANAIENIDIGGPSMIRAAAKNCTHVAVVTNPGMYDRIAQQMEQHDGSLDSETRFALAVEAFRHTSHYDTVIARYLRGIEGEHEVGPDRLTVELIKREPLECGENPHQSADFYVYGRVEEPCVSNAEQLSGPRLSYNAALDMDAAIELAKEFDGPAVVVARRGIPFAAALADSLDDACRRALTADPASMCGCAIMLNRPLERQVAQALSDGFAASDALPESLVAPDFDEDALVLLCEKPGWAEHVRVFRTRPVGGHRFKEGTKHGCRVTGGGLVEDRDILGFDRDTARVITELEPSTAQLDDLAFAWLCCKHVRSDAVVVVADLTLVGVGAGQTNRIAAAEIALQRAGDRARGAVLASDGPLASPAVVGMAREAGIAAVIQPGGVGGDADVIGAANRLGLSMLVTGVQHLRH